MWVIPPIRVCWPRRSARSVARWRGSKRPGPRPGLQPAIGAARRVDVPVRSPPSCGCAVLSSAIKPRPRCPYHRGTGRDRRHRRAGGPRKGRLQQAINHLDTMVQRTQRVVTQARSRLAGVMPESATRLVSLHDADARPIRKGRLGKPVEFGYKAQVVDNADGVILDHTVEIGNPVDAPQLAPAIQRITRRTGRPPRAVTADRGYGYATVERDLHALGVRSVAIPRVNKPGSARREFEHRRAFRDKVKWRTGSEGRINHLKRSYGWNRTELTGITGARTWCGHGVFAHNLVKI